MAEEFGTVVWRRPRRAQWSNRCATPALHGEIASSAPTLRLQLSAGPVEEGDDRGFGSCRSALRGEDWYSAQDVSTYFGTSVTALDTMRRKSPSMTVRSCPTVGDPRHRAVPHARCPWRSAWQHPRSPRCRCGAIRSQFGDGKKVAVIGGGWIGLEVAAAASPTAAMSRSSPQHQTLPALCRPRTGARRISSRICTQGAGELPQEREHHRVHR